MTTPEGRNVALIKKLIIKAGGSVRKCSWENRRGAPDLFVMLPNVHAWIEVKTEEGVLKPHQLREHYRMREAGCRVFTVYTEEQARIAVDRLIASSRYSGM